MARKPEGYTKFMNRRRQENNQHVYKRAEQYGDLVREEHRYAPRGGSYLNSLGQPRSASGEAPAPEHGDLMKILETPPVPANTGAGESASGNYLVPANYALLESGTSRMGPRPLGAIAFTRLQEDIERE